MVAVMDVVTLDDPPPCRKDYRCPSCGSLLFRATIRLAASEAIETTCRRCKTAVVFVAAEGDAVQ